MSKYVILHSLILIGAICLLFFWVTDEQLAVYSLQLTAILLLTLLVSHRFLRLNHFKMLESVISTIAVLLVVGSTGGVASPFFFLNYFLLFELSLILEPLVPLILAGTIILFYFTTSETGTTLLQMAELLAFPCMTPLAYFFGKIYRKEENQKREIKNLNKKIEKLEEELVEEEIKSA